MPQTIADGLRTRYIGDRNLAVMRDHVHDMMTVSEEDILETLAFIWTYLKIIVEPSSAVALAPLLLGNYEQVDQRVGVILSGGNAAISDVGCLLGQRNQAQITSPAAPAKPTLPDPPQRTRILVTSPLNAPDLDLLRTTADVDVELDLDEDELLQRIPDYQVLIVGPQQQIDSQIIEYGYGLQIIGCVSSHLDNINVSAVRDLGIRIVYAPGGNSVAIAEHTMARMLLLADRFGDGILAGKTLGLIGFGHVSQQVAQRAHAFDMKVIANQPRLTPELAYSTGVEAADLVDLLTRADYVSLHVPYTAETESIIGASELAQMKESAYLINTGHTELIDEVALFYALEAGSLAGASLSMFPDEIGPVSPVSLNLRRHERTIVSEHVTSIIKQQRPNLAQTVAAEIAEILSTKRVDQALSLELVPVEQVTPHERIDDKRVARLMDRLENDGRLVNPPITTFWKGRYVILDGATRFASFSRLGYRYIIVQVVNAQQGDFDLHTWYHAISHEQQTLPISCAKLSEINGMRLDTTFWQSYSTRAWLTAVHYAISWTGKGAPPWRKKREGSDRLALMNELVDAYSSWGDVERTLVTDLPAPFSSISEFSSGRRISAVQTGRCL